MLPIPTVSSTSRGSLQRLARLASVATWRSASTVSPSTTYFGPHKHDFPCILPGRGGLGTHVMNVYQIPALSDNYIYLVDHSLVQQDGNLLCRTKMCIDPSEAAPVMDAIQVQRESLRLLITHVKN